LLGENPLSTWCQPPGTPVAPVVGGEVSACHIPSCEPVVPFFEGVLTRGKTDGVRR
jgi:hypothetical protein